MNIFLSIIRLQIFFLIYFVFNSLGNLLSDSVEAGFAGEKMLGVIIIITTYFPILIAALMTMFIVSVFVYRYFLVGKEKILNLKLIMYCVGLSIFSGIIGYLKVITLFW